MSERNEASVVQWEYVVVEDHDEYELSNWGLAGWEAVSVQWYQGDMYRVLMKRRKLPLPAPSTEAPR